MVRVGVRVEVGAGAMDVASVFWLPNWSLRRSIHSKAWELCVDQHCPREIEHETHTSFEKYITTVRKKSKKQ